MSDDDHFNRDDPVWGRYPPEWQIGEVAPWNYIPPPEGGEAIETL